MGLPFASTSGPAWGLRLTLGLALRFGLALRLGLYTAKLFTHEDKSGDNSGSALILSAIDCVWELFKIITFDPVLKTFVKSIWFSTSSNSFCLWPSFKLFKHSVSGCFFSSENTSFEKAELFLKKFFNLSAEWAERGFSLIKLRLILSSAKTNWRNYWTNLSY